MSGATWRLVFDERRAVWRVGVEAARDGFSVVELVGRECPTAREAAAEMQVQRVQALKTWAALQEVCA